jgi:hypothetical protein
MTLPEAPAVVCGWNSAKFGAAILLLLVVLAFPARAAEDDAFSATVKLDASADSAAKAREAARLDGQRRALAEIAGRLAGPGGAAKSPKLDDNAITNLVASFEVANERMSPVRYMADYTFHFRPAETRRALRLPETSVTETPAAPSGKPAEASGKPVTVLPVYQAGGRSVLWEDPNPWRAAWAQRPAAGPLHLTVPLGDSSDVVAIDADKARAGNGDALATIARQNGGDEAIVTAAAARGGKEASGLDITVKRYRGGQLVDSRSLAVSANPGEKPDDFFLRAANAVAGNIETGWKKEPPGKIDQQGTMIASIAISSLDDWLQLRDRLAGVGAIRKVELMALSQREAVVQIQYSGSTDQLKASLGESDLDLIKGEAPTDKAWRVARSPASGAR